MAKKPKRPTDTNQLAKRIVDLATGEAKAGLAADPSKHSSGSKGGYARAAGLTDAQRSKIAKKAAEARWSNKNGIKSDSERGSEPEDH